MALAAHLGEVQRQLKFDSSLPCGMGPPASPARTTVLELLGYTWHCNFLLASPLAGPLWLLPTVEDELHFQSCVSVAISERHQWNMTSQSVLTHDPGPEAGVFTCSMLGGSSSDDDASARRSKGHEPQWFQARPHTMEAVLLRVSDCTKWRSERMCV